MQKISGLQTGQGQSNVVEQPGEAKPDALNRGLSKNCLARQEEVKALSFLKLLRWALQKWAGLGTTI